MSYNIADIEFELSEEGIMEAIIEVERIQTKLTPAMGRLINELTKNGAVVARANLMTFEANDSGTLASSITHIPFDGEAGYVKTDCPYAIYVEFGTGPLGAASPHPMGGGYRGTRWKYLNERVGHWVYTYGMGSRPFMYQTMRTLEQEAEATGGRIVAQYMA